MKKLITVVLILVCSFCAAQKRLDSVKIFLDKDGNIFRNEYYSNKNLVMKKKIAKMLRNKAEAETVGLPVSKTRKKYMGLKKEYKEQTKVVVSPKFKVSKRQQRLTA